MERSSLVPKPFAWQSGWMPLFAGALVAGVVLRLIYVMDIEYKGDERWMFERTQQVGKTESLPWFGMPTSFEVLHPGGTVWIFVAIGRLFDVQEPTELARACQFVNVATILLLVLFAVRAVPASEREPWLWAAALVSVNPLAVLFQRKIWSPSVMPVFSLLLVACWWHRSRRWGSFAWGFVGAMLGFFYPAAMFLAAGFALWAFFFDRRNVRWGWWGVGSILGALPLIPWFQYILTTSNTSSMEQRRWSNLFEFKFWTRWLTEPFGISLNYALGDDFEDFLGYPILAGHPTYLVGILHLLIVLAAVALMTHLAVKLWRQRERMRELWIGRASQTAFTQNACLWGFGLVMTVSLLPIHRHYMAITFPLMFLWLARAALSYPRWKQARLANGRIFLLALCIVQLLISASFLAYIHANQRPIQGDYGMPYGAQHSQ